MLGALCIALAVIGAVLILLGIVPATAAHVPRGLSAGIALLIVGVALYVILAGFGLT
jgi:hypothetical protein